MQSSSPVFDLVPRIETDLRAAGLLPRDLAPVPLHLGVVGLLPRDPAPVPLPLGVVLPIGLEELLGFFKKFMREPVAFTEFLRIFSRGIDISDILFLPVDFDDSNFWYPIY